MTERIKNFRQFPGLGSNIEPLKYPTARRLVCMANALTTSGANVWHCTRVMGHEGEHEAGNARFKRAYARWETEEVNE